MISATLDFEFFPVKHSEVEHQVWFLFVVDFTIGLISVMSIIVQVRYYVNTGSLYDKIYKLHDDKEGLFGKDEILIEQKVRSELFETSIHGSIKKQGSTMTASYLQGSFQEVVKQKTDEHTRISMLNNEYRENLTI